MADEQARRRPVKDPAAPPAIASAEDAAKLAGKLIADLRHDGPVFVSHSDSGAAGSAGAASPTFLCPRCGKDHPIEQTVCTDSAPGGDIRAALHPETQGYIDALERRLAVYEADATRPTMAPAMQLRAVTWKMGATLHVASIGETRIGHAKFSGSRTGDWIAHCQLDSSALDGFGTDENAMRAVEARVLEVVGELVTLSVAPVEASTDE